MQQLKKLGKLKSCIYKESWKQKGLNELNQRAIQRTRSQKKKN